MIMSYLLSHGLLLGLVVVAGNPSPYFGALGLVVVSGMGCGLIVTCGGVFLSLILFLIYLGGMLVVFAYSSALASDLYPEAGSARVLFSCMLYAVMVGLAEGWLVWWRSPGNMSVTLGAPFEGSVQRSEMLGVAEMYSSGGWLLVVATFALLVTLLVVFTVVRGKSWGTLRAV